MSLCHACDFFSRIAHACNKSIVIAGITYVGINPRPRQEWVACDGIRSELDELYANECPCFSDAKYEADVAVSAQRYADSITAQVAAELMIDEALGDNG
jgi:hypothetical protein